MVFSRDARDTYIYGKKVTYRTVRTEDVNFPTHRIRNTHFMELGLPEYETVQYINLSHVAGEYIDKIDKRILKIIRVDFDADMFRRQGRQMVPMIQNDHYYFYYILIDLYPFNEMRRMQLGNKSQFILRTNPGHIFTDNHQPENAYEFIPLNEFSRIEDAATPREHHDIINNFINHIFYSKDEGNNHSQFMKIEKEIVATLLKSSKKALKKDIKKTDKAIEHVTTQIDEGRDMFGYLGPHLANMRTSKARGTTKLQKLKGRSSSSSTISSSKEYNLREERISDEMIAKLKSGLLVGGSRVTDF